MQRRVRILRPRRPLPPARPGCKALLLAMLGLACDQNKPSAEPQSRAAAVQAKTPATASAPEPSAAPAPAATPRRKALCADQWEAAPKAFPTLEIGRAGAAQAQELPENPGVGRGRFTWLNLWAAWCVPCKEEIPRLLSWEKRLATGGVKFQLLFVSLDDDKRQLHAFLEGQPAGGLRSTYWLREGKERTRWLEEIEIESDPELPGHILVDPEGKVRCYIQGAVEDDDFARVRELVGG